MLKTAKILFPAGLAWLIIIMLPACSGRDKRPMKRDDFKAIVLDMHLADGVANSKRMAAQLKTDEEVNIYSYVLKKHKVSRGEFELALNYYSKHTGEYLQIYKEIVEDLRSMDDSIKHSDKPKEEIAETDSSNLWQRKKNWALPEDGRTNPITHRIREPEHGIYTLSADIKLFPDDGSVAQRMTILVKYADGTHEENSAGNIKKDGKFTRHEVFIRTDPEKELEDITCWVLNHSQGTSDKHASVKNIRLERKESD